jgi:3-hydroxy-9,10-secoandrosta-1,3,5(10)-triene-9,17-dione monooxygenase
MLLCKYDIMVRHSEYRMTIQNAETSAPRDLESLLAEVDRLGPVLANRAAETEAGRTLPAANMAEMFDAGLLRYFVPTRFGGYELEWGSQVAIGRRLAYYCASSAWIACVVGSHSAYVGRMEAAAQADVWADGPDVLIATGSVSRNVSVETLEDGYRLSGRWSFSSGVDHSDWALLRASPTNDHRQSYFLIPKSDFTIVDDWFVSGMSGTGSKGVQVDNAFIPAHRTLGLSALMAPNPPGAAVNSGVVFRYNFRPFAGSALLGPILGTAEAILTAYREMMREGQGGLSVDDIQSQLRLAESEAEIGAAACLLESLVERQQRYARTNANIPQAERIALVRDRTFTARLCFTASERLITSIGAEAVLTEHPIQRHFRDLAGMVQQIGVNWDRNMTDVVKAIFGRPTGIPYLNIHLQDQP